MMEDVERYFTCVWKTEIKSDVCTRHRHHEGFPQALKQLDCKWWNESLKRVLFRGKSCDPKTKPWKISVA